MSRSPDLLDRLRVTSPCSADWDSMPGNDEVRFCKHCSLHVHNLSAMTREEAEELVANSGGRLCVRYHQTPARKILSAPPITKPRQIRASRLAASAFTAALSVSSAALQTPAQVVQPNSASAPFSVKADKAQPDQQTGYASLAGTLFDPVGAVVPGAKLTLTNAQTNASQTAESSDEGAYRFESLEGGEYTLTIESTGFKKFTLEKISLHEGEERRVDATLQVGAVMGDVVVVSPVQQWIYHYDEREEKPEVDESVQSFIEAAESDEAADVKRMLRRGVNVNARNEYDETALMFAASSERIVKLLIKWGADVNARSEFGVTPIMYAMLGEDSTITKLLLDAGADPNAQDKDGRTALMFAAFDSRLEKIKILLEAGANVNARDKEGKTALTYAREGNRAETISALTVAGAIE